MNAETLQHPSGKSDHTWFADRIDELLPDLFGRAMRLCRNHANAEDLVADAVARSWQALPTLADRGSFRAWIFRIMNNAFFSQRRTARAQAEHTPIDTVADEFSLFEQLHQPVLLWSSSPEQVFLDRLLRADLEQAIDELPGAFRETLVLIDIQGFSYRDAADLLDVPIGTVRSRLARARTRLQQSLWRHAVEAGVVGTTNDGGSNDRRI